MTPGSPGDLVEFQHRFADEQACWSYLLSLRWPDGYRCPRCEHREYYELFRRRLLECKRCRYQTSVTAGTLLHRTKLPLRHWFWAVVLVAWHKIGISAKQLQRDLGIGSYETAWLLLHKVRRALKETPGFFRLLTARVEVDDAYVGGVERGAGGRGTETKAKIVVAVEEKRAVAGRATLTVVEEMSGEELVGATVASVEPGATVKTDGWGGYGGLGDAGFRHRPIVEGAPENAGKLFPRVHRVISLCKRWLLGTHGGRVSHEHLQRYLDEFQYRFNRRGQIQDLFRRVLRRLTFNAPFSYRELVATVG
jgi:transposase-like protein